MLNLVSIFKLFVIVLIIICLFTIAVQLYRKNISKLLVNIVFLVILLTIFFLPYYFRDTNNYKYAKENNIKTITVATEGTYFPWNYVSSTGNPEGFDIDVAKELAKRMGVNIKFVTAPFQSLINNLSNNQYDMVVAAMSITKDRQNSVTFSIPYANVPVVFFGNKNIYAKYKNSGINTLKNVLKGQSVGTQSGTTWPFYLNKEFKDIINVRYYSNQPQLMMDVSSGRIHVGFSEIPSVVEFIKKNPNIIMFGPKLSIKDSDLFGAGIAVAVTKGNTSLLNKINKALNIMQKDGIIKALSLKHFNTDISYGG